jgi:hypothetical protein
MRDDHLFDNPHHNKKRKKKKKKKKENTVSFGRKEG